MKTQSQLAREIATVAHHGQYRWDGTTPYIAHPGAVAKAVDQKYRAFEDTPGVNLGFTVDDAVAAAWLHDVVEDTPVTYDNLRASGVSPTVIDAVAALTKQDSETYLQYLLQVRKNAIALVVKIEDIKHNMSDLDRMYEKYQLALYILEQQ
jgi:(p)ppGpp synthase/HD superfamily hydrolase